MNNIILIITFLIGVCGLIFKTTTEDKVTGRNRLNRSGVVVLLLMFLGLLTNMFVNYKEERDKQINDIILKKKNEGDSIRRAQENEMNDLRWSNILDQTKTSLDHSEMQNKLLEKNTKLQEQLSNQTTRFNKVLEDRLRIAQIELFNIKNPLDSMALSFTMVFQPDDEFNSSLRNILKREKKSRYLNIYSEVKSEFPAAVAALQNLVVKTSFFPKEYQNDPWRTEFHATYFKFDLGSKHSFSFDSGRNVEINFDSASNELTVELKGFPCTDMYATLESFNYLCTLPCLIEISRRDETSLINSSIEFKRISLEPLKQKAIQRGIYFYPMNLNVIEVTNTHKAWKSKNQHCLF